jgi:hypothetical protein
LLNSGAARRITAAFKVQQLNQARRACVCDRSGRHFNGQTERAKLRKLLPSSSDALPNLNLLLCKRRKSLPEMKKLYSCTENCLFLRSCVYRNATPWTLRLLMQCAPANPASLDLQGNAPPHCNAPTRSSADAQRLEYQHQPQMKLRSNLQ